MWQAIRHGIARTLDLFGAVPPLNDVPCRSDAEALRSDWEAVGSDLRRAMDEFPAPVAATEETDDG